MPFTVAGGAGALLTAVAVRWFGGCKLTALGWTLIPAACLVGGILFAFNRDCVSMAIDTFDGSASCYGITALSHAAWQVLVAVALYYGAVEVEGAVAPSTWTGSSLQGLKRRYMLQRMMVMAAPEAIRPRLATIPFR